MEAREDSRVSCNVFCFVAAFAIFPLIDIFIYDYIQYIYICIHSMNDIQHKCIIYIYVHKVCICVD